MDWGDAWNALTSGVDLFTKVVPALNKLKDLLQDLRRNRPTNDPATTSPAEQQRIASLERTIAELQQRLTLFSSTALLNDMQAWQAMQEILFAARLQQARAQDSERIAQTLQRIDATTQQITETVTDIVKGPMELLANLLPFVYPAIRTGLIEVIDLNPDVKAFLPQYAATAGYHPVIDEKSLETQYDQWRKSPFTATPFTRLVHARDQAIKLLLLSNAEPPSQAGPQA